MSLCYTEGKELAHYTALTESGVVKFSFQCQVRGESHATLLPMSPTPYMEIVLEIHAYHYCSASTLLLLTE